MKHQYFILFITVFLSSSAFAQLFSSGLNGGDKKYSTEVINPYDTVKAGDTIQLATKVSLKDNWKGYYLNPGENGVGSKIEWDNTLLELEGLTFPTPKSKQSGDGYDFYYLNEYVIISNLKVSPDAKPGTYTVTHTDKITVCEIGGQCIPGRGVDTPLSITIGNETKTNSKKSLIDSALKIAVNKNTAVEANASAEGFELSIEFDSNLDLSSSKDLVLIPDNKYNTAKSPFVTLEQTDTGYSFKYLLPSDHEVEENFSAILTTKDAKLTGSTTSLYLETKLTGKVTEGKEAKVAWTSAEKEEHAAFYDPDSKILTDAAEADEGQNIFTILFFAFIGGMILNLMPCVFPVLGLKVMGFAQMSGNDPKKIKIHGIVFTLGVLVSMWVLAGALLALSVTTKINWGEQMGNPIFVGCIIILLFVMGLNMYGVFEIGPKLTSAGGNLQNKKGYSGSFFSGIH